MSILLHPKNFKGCTRYRRKIAEVKPSIQPTQDMTVIDARALHLLPGFIDVHTHLGLYDEGTGWAGNDANETSEVSTPHIRSLTEFTL